MLSANSGHRAQTNLALFEAPFLFVFPITVARVRTAPDFCGGASIVLATSRTHSMKRWTGGLNVRFFSVTSKVGHGGIGNSSGSSFTEYRSGLNRRIETGNAETKRSLMLSILRKATETVVTVIGGIGNPAAWNASAIAAPPGVSKGGRINTASARSARPILRRLAHRLCFAETRQIRS